MSGEFQKTLGGEVRLEGVGVHSGEEATLRIRPAPPDAGLRFRRVDLDGAPEIPADLDHVVDTDLATTLGAGDARVQTVEHLLAVLGAHGITNAVIELDGPEPPIRDGSFRDYFEAVAEAGVERQDASFPVLQIRRPVTLSLEGENASYVALPADGFRLSCTIDYPHPGIGRQYGSFEIDGEGATFGREIAPARTFGFEVDAEALWERGLARAASTENTVILDDTGVVSGDLRFDDEFLRHKVGDVLGDLVLLGARLEGHVVAERPSHQGNVSLARKLRLRTLREGTPAIGIGQIMEHLPHRFPMLLVDRILEFDGGKRIVGIKNVTINEPFFQGHYPGHPVMPGVLVVEAMAQVGGLLLLDVVEDPEEKVVYFMSLDNVKWRKPVTPGDQIVFEVELLRYRRQVCKMRGTGKVEGKVVAEADLMARVVDR